MSEYDVVYETKKSYYDLFKAAGISWKKTTKLNPKADPDAVAVKKKEIETLLENNRNEIETGKLRALLIDECHLMWGDLSGYIWAAAFGGKLPPETCLGKTDQ
jgi:Winged helix-turn helix